MTRGVRGGLVTLVMGRWEARGGSRAGPGLERKSDPSPFGDLPSVKLVSMDLIQSWKLVGLTNAWRWLCKLLDVIVDAFHEAR